MHYHGPVPPNVIEDAICIRQWDFSETSQTVSLFTRGRGVVRGLAKGSRRPKAPYSGGIELLTRGMAGLIVKGERGGGGGGGTRAAATEGAGLTLITEWDLTAMYPGLRRRLEAYNAGLYMADLVHHMVTDHDPHEALFEAMVGGLERIGGGGGRSALRADTADTGRSALRADTNGQRDDVGAALLAFQWAALVETGYKPELDADVQTGEALGAPPSPNRGVMLFSPSLGGVISGGGSGGGKATADQSGEHALHAHAWRVRAETIELLRKVAGANGGTDAALASAPPATTLRANRLLAAYIRHTLGREPRSMPVVFGARLPK